MAGTKLTVLAALRNYRQDLTHQDFAGGHENINYNSGGTPEFKTDEEVEDYLGQLDRLIAEVETLVTDIARLEAHNG